MANELLLKYGCNPNQKPSRVFMEQGELPFEVLSGAPGYINLLDAFNAWQLVCELKEATGVAAAASFKHVSPAGAAIGLALSDIEKQMFFVGEGYEETPQAAAYARARGCDRLCSFGDFVALSDCCDKSTALLLKQEVSDGIIAPDYTEEALEILRSKRDGKYNVIKIDKEYNPKPIERRDVFGITFEQGRNELKLTDEIFSNIVSSNKELTEEAKRDLLIAMITLKYTQSNSVCYAHGGQTTGVGAGQQSRIHCTRLAGDKSDLFFLRRHPKTLALPFVADVKRAVRDNAVDLYVAGRYDELFATDSWKNTFTEKPDPITEKERSEYLSSLKGVCLASDAFFPFGDNVDRAAASGVGYIVEAGGSVRDDEVIATADRYGMLLAFCGIRLFHH